MSNANALAAIDPKAVLARILNDEPTASIAASLNVTSAGLSLWLIRNAEAEWKDAQVVRALRRKEEAEAELDKTATNGLDLARARERLRAAQWDLERVCRRIYGQDTLPNAGQPIQINIGIHTPSTVEAQVIDNPDSATDK